MSYEYVFIRPSMFLFPSECKARVSIDSAKWFRKGAGGHARVPTLSERFKGASPAIPAMALRDDTAIAGL